MLDCYTGGIGATITYDVKRQHRRRRSGRAPTRITATIASLPPQRAGVVFGFVYDAVGRPYRMTRGGTVARGWGWSGSRLVAEYGSGGIARRWLPGPGTESVADVDGSGANPRFVATDDTRLRGRGL